MSEVTASERTLVERCAFALMTPYLHQSPTEWRGTILRCLQDLARVPACMFADTRMGIVQTYPMELREVVGVDLLFAERNEGIRRLSQLRPQVFNKQEIVAGEWRDYWRSEEFGRIWQPNRWLDSGSIVEWEGSDMVMLNVFDGQHKAKTCSRESLSRLDVLRESLRVHATLALAGWVPQSALVASLEGLGLAAAIFDEAGHLRELTPTAAHLVAGSGRGLLRDYAWRVAESALHLARPLNQNKQQGSIGNEPRAIVESDGSFVEIVASHAPAEAGVPSRIMVVMKVLRPRPLTELELVDLGMTARMIDVARLLRTGASISEVVDELAITKSTAEKHVAAIKRRLNVRSRKEIFDIMDGHRRYS